MDQARRPGDRLAPGRITAEGPPEGRGGLWVSGRFTARVRGPGPEPGRVVRVRGPFATIGRDPGADLRIDDPAVEDQHAFLILDHRGVFGCDLRSRAGTRFAGALADSARLGAGDILEVAGRRIELLQLRIDDRIVEPPLSDDDPLADAGDSDLAHLTLEPIGGAGPPWMLGSALAFAGRGEACAIRVEGAANASVDCALLRGPSSAYVIGLAGGRARLNGRAVEGASALLDGDDLTLGPSRFVVRIRTPEVPPDPAPSFDGGVPAVLAGPQSEALLALIAEAASDSGPGPTHAAIEALRRFGLDAADLFGAQQERVEALGREIVALRIELQGRGGLDRIPEPLRLDLPARAPAESTESAAWLLDRIRTLEAENRTTWRDLAGRIAAGLRSRGRSDRSS